MDQEKNVRVWISPITHVLKDWCRTDWGVRGIYGIFGMGSMVIASKGKSLVWVFKSDSLEPLPALRHPFPDPGNYGSCEQSVSFIFTP